MVNKRLTAYMTDSGVMVTLRWEGGEGDEVSIKKWGDDVELKLLVYELSELIEVLKRV